MVVTWRTSGFPDPALRDQFSTFERALGSLAFGLRSRLVASLISGDGKSWSFYCVSYVEFLQDLNDALAGHAKFPLQIQWRDDAAWSEYETLRRFLESKLDQASASR